MAQTPEGKIKERVRKVLKFVGAQFFMPSASIYGKAGAHDFICCLHGLYVSVEAKATKRDKPTDLQIEFAKEVTKAGGRTYLVHRGNIREWAEEIIAFYKFGKPLIGHDFTKYARKRRRTNRPVPEPAPDLAGDPYGEVYTL